MSRVDRSAAMMEKGRVYQPRGARSQLVAWRLRYFFCSDHGLCYQKVSSQMRPVGEKRTIPWGAITKVRERGLHATLRVCVSFHNRQP